MTDYLKEYQRWLTGDIFDAATKKELKKINDPKEIEDRFYKELSFGTGGMRGVVGAGTNRMNFYTVGKATQGLSNYLNSAGGGSVAIAYDSRKMSKEFAEDTARILAANGIKAYIFSGVRPTPELSFAVRRLKAKAGVVITASHNPPEYNGYKVYNEDGGQIVPPQDKLITESVRGVKGYSCIKRVSFEEGVRRGLIVTIGEETDEAYFAAVCGTVLCPEVIKKRAQSLKIVYTPLNGAGRMPVLNVLSRMGFKNVSVVSEQAEPDGNFPTLRYPNPEDPAAFKLALELASKNGADIVMATDPDADRLGIYAGDKSGNYRAFTGNMSGALILEYRLARMREKGILQDIGKNGAVITTVVSTDMAKAIAAKYGVTLIEVLTGFKYIGEKIKEFERAVKDNGGKYCAEKGAYKYLFGFEESYGCLTGSYARDKDAVSAVAALAEAACYYAEKGLTLPEVMDNMYSEYGYYKEGLWSKTFYGADGAAAMRRLTARLREDTPSEIGGYRVTEVKDFLTGRIFCFERGNKADKGGTGLPVSDVLYFELESGWCCVRPSGTEPKIKVYMGVKGGSGEDADKMLKDLSAAFTGLIKERE